MRLLVLPLFVSCAACTTGAPSDRGQAVSLDSVRVVNAAQRFEAVVHYPRSRSLPDPIRRALEDSARSYVLDFQQRAEPVTSDQPDGYVNSLYGGVEAFYEGPQLVSGRFVVNESFAGDAHPSHWARCFVYDRQTGTSADLRSLFVDGAPYLYVLSEQVRAALRTSFALDTLRIEDEAMFLEGTSPVPETFACTSLSEDGVHVFFGPYQIGSYAFGEHEAVVPWANLRRMVRPDGLAAPFVGAFPAAPS